jgi:hypothetical protein
MEETIPKKFLHILEYFGYTVEYSGSASLRTRHGNKAFFWIFSVSGGALFRAIFNLGPGAIADNNALLDFCQQGETACCDITCDEALPSRRSVL